MFGRIYLWIFLSFFTRAKILRQCRFVKETIDADKVYLTRNVCSGKFCSKFFAGLFVTDSLLYFSLANNLLPVKPTCLAKINRQSLCVK